MVRLKFEFDEQLCHEPISGHLPQIPQGSMQTKGSKFFKFSYFLVLSGRLTRPSWVGETPCLERATLKGGTTQSGEPG